MKLIRSTLHKCADVLTDPGEHGACGGGTNIQPTVAEEHIEGDVVIELTIDDLEDLRYTCDYLIDLANQEVADEFGDGYDVVWIIDVDGRFATLSVDV